MKRECYVIRETDPTMKEHLGVETYFIGPNHVVVLDVLEAQKFATIEAAKKFNGTPETIPYEIIPVTVEFQLHKDKIERVEVITMKYDYSYFPDNTEVTPKQAREMLTDYHAGKVEMDPRMLEMVERYAKEE